MSVACAKASTSPQLRHPSSLPAIQGHCNQSTFPPSISRVEPLRQSGILPLLVRVTDAVAKNFHSTHGASLKNLRRFGRLADTLAFTIYRKFRRGSLAMPYIALAVHGAVLKNSELI
jgi:hypothetical protein